MTSKVILQPYHIIRLEERFTQEELADIFGIDERTIRRWKYPTDLPKQKGE